MSELHVVPNGDLLEHDADEDCVCVPTPRFESGGIVYQHHSLDGRELAER